MVFKKSFFKIGMWHSRPYRDPPPFMANAILNFHFDFLTPSLIYGILSRFITCLKIRSFTISEPPLLLACRLQRSIHSLAGNSTPFFLERYLIRFKKNRRGKIICRDTLIDVVFLILVCIRDCEIFSKGLPCSALYSWQRSKTIALEMFPSGKAWLLQGTRQQKTMY